MTDRDALVETARAFAREHIDPKAAEWERDRRLPRETITAAARAGLCDLLVAPQRGGKGQGIDGMAGVMQALAAGDMGFAFALVCHNNLAGSISARGSEAQQDAYLAPMARADLLGAFLLTEPEAGTDAAAIRTRATRDGDGWLLSGEKAWITNASDADLLCVYAQTEPGSGPRGIAAFLVRADQPGVERGAPYHMFGAHATGAGGFTFRDVRLDAGQLFLPPGQAFRAAMAAIDIARVVVSAMCAGMLRRGLEIAVDYLRNRDAFGGPLSDKQGLQWMLADVATDIEAGAALTARATAAIDAGDPGAGVLAAHAKKFATRVTMSGLSDCMQALGANGYRQDWPLARHLASAKMAQYLDGTTEVQNIVIARGLFGR